MPHIIQNGGWRPRPWHALDELVVSAPPREALAHKDIQQMAKRASQSGQYCAFIVLPVRIALALLSPFVRM